MLVILICLILGISINAYSNATEESLIEEPENLEVKTQYTYNEETNTVTGKMIANHPLKNTKVSWKLSEDKLTYTNDSLTSNGSYYTEVEDIYGNTAKVLIHVTLIDDKRTEYQNGIPI